MAKSRSSLHYLPCEIRIMIFQKVIPLYSDGVIPPLVVALRPESALYYEALEVFYERKMVCFRVEEYGSGNFQLEDIKETILPLVKGLKVSFRKASKLRNNDEQLGIYPDLDCNPDLRVLQAVNVQVLHLDFSDLGTCVKGRYEETTGQWIRKFRLLHKLQITIKFSNSGNYTWWFMDIGLGDVIRKLNAHIGSAGRLITVSTKCESTVWAWDVKKGQNLSWLDEVSESEDLPKNIS